MSISSQKMSRFFSMANSLAWPQKPYSVLTYLSSLSCVIFFSPHPCLHPPPPPNKVPFASTAPTLLPSYLSVSCISFCFSVLAASTNPRVLSLFFLLRCASYLILFYGFSMKYPFSLSQLYMWKYI